MSIFGDIWDNPMFRDPSDPPTEFVKLPPLKADGTHDYSACPAEWTLTEVLRDRPGRVEHEMMVELYFYRWQRDDCNAGLLIDRRKDGSIFPPVKQRYQLRDTRQRRERDMRIIAQRKARRQAMAKAESAAFMAKLDADRAAAQAAKRAQAQRQPSSAQPSGPAGGVGDAIQSKVVAAPSPGPRKLSDRELMPPPPLPKASSRSGRQAQTKMSTTAGIQKSKWKPKTKMVPIEGRK